MLEIVTSNFASEDQKDGEMLWVRRLSEWLEAYGVH